MKILKKYETLQPWYYIHLEFQSRQIYKSILLVPQSGPFSRLAFRGPSNPYFIFVTFYTTTIWGLQNGGKWMKGDKFDDNGWRWMKWIERGPTCISNACMVYIWKTSTCWQGCKEHKCWMPYLTTGNRWNSVPHYVKRYNKTQCNWHSKAWWW